MRGLDAGLQDASRDGDHRRAGPRRLDELRRARRREITDEKVIRSFDGRTFLDDDGALPVRLSVYLQDADETRPLWALGVRGGTLRYEYRGADGLWIVSEFEAPRALDEVELRSLCDFMRGQWSDGAGPNFAGELADENDGTGPFGEPMSVHVSQSPR